MTKRILTRSHAGWEVLLTQRTSCPLQSPSLPGWAGSFRDQRLHLTQCSAQLRTPTLPFLTASVEIQDVFWDFSNVGRSHSNYAFLLWFFSLHALPCPSPHLTPASTHSTTPVCWTTTYKNTPLACLVSCWVLEIKIRHSGCPLIACSLLGGADMETSHSTQCNKCCYHGT